MSNESSTSYDPALTGSADDGMFGIPTTLENARLVYIPVPWEVTTSYGNGASRGPEAIRKASPQLDLHVRQLPGHYRQGFHILDIHLEILELNTRCKPLAEAAQQELESTGALQTPELVQAQATINNASQLVNEWVYDQSKALDEEGKLLALIGGDHSSPYGLIKYLSEKYQGDFGVLHVDAHLDLRQAYQGFAFSHASIMNNVMTLPQAPKALVQVGIRDFCEEEASLAAEDHRISVFYDEDIKTAAYEGQTFANTVERVLQSLPQNVYISFDIDGLRPDLCPHTGTPVPGGLEFEQAVFLIQKLVKSGRKIIGFDLCEVCPNPDDVTDEWDGNVGARILFQLSSWMVESQSNPAGEMKK